MFQTLLSFLAGLRPSQVGFRERRRLLVSVVLTFVSSDVSTAHHYTSSILDDKGELTLRAG